MHLTVLYFLVPTDEYVRRRAHPPQPAKYHYCSSLAPQETTRTTRHHPHINRARHYLPRPNKRTTYLAPEPPGPCPNSPTRYHSAQHSNSKCTRRRHDQSSHRRTPFTHHDRKTHSIYKQASFPFHCTCVAHFINRPTNTPTHPRPRPHATEHNPPHKTILSTHPPDTSPSSNRRPTPVRMQKHTERDNHSSQTKYTSCIEQASKQGKGTSQDSRRQLPLSNEA